MPDLIIVKAAQAEGCTMWHRADAGHATKMHLSDAPAAKILPRRHLAFTQAPNFALVIRRAPRAMLDKVDGDMVHLRLTSGGLKKMRSLGQ
jgi:hypothetical protein